MRDRTQENEAVRGGSEIYYLDRGGGDGAVQRSARGADDSLAIRLAA